MGVLFQRPSGPTKINQVQINQSNQGYPVPVVMGKGKVQQTLLWLDGFRSKKVNVSGGKGFGGKGGSEYEYSADVLGGLCDGGANGILGIGDVWAGQSWLSNSNTAESYTVSGSNPSYTPANADSMTGDHGVFYTVPVSGNYNDLASTGPTSINTSLIVPLKRVAYVSGAALAAGTYSVDGNNTYYFSTGNAGAAVSINYTFSLKIIKRSQVGLVPSELNIPVSGDLPFSADDGVVYYSTGSDNPLNGKALIRVSGTPTDAGTYSIDYGSYTVTGNPGAETVTVHRAASYSFASGDVNQEVQMTYKLNNSSALPAGTHTSLAFELIPGAPKDAPAAILLTNYPSEALGYTGIAKVLYTPMDMGYGAQVQQNTFEVMTEDMWGGGNPDCNPVQCVWKVLTNGVWGLGNGPVPFPPSAIDNFSPGSTSSTTYRDVVMGLNPVGYWRFDETSGSVVRDQSGSNNATYMPSAAGVTFAQPGAIQLDSDTSSQCAALTYASVPNSAAIQLANFTFAMWVKVDPANTNSYLALAGSLGDTAGWLINRAGNASTIYLQMHTSAAQDQELPSTVPIFDGNWHFIAAGMSGNIAYLSVDGETWKTRAISMGTGIVNTTNPLIILPSGRGGCVASADEVCLFGSLLDITDVQRLYNIGVNGPEMTTAGSGYGTWGTPSPTGVAQSDSSAASWFAANGFFISPVIDRQDTAASLIGQWLEAGMCAAFMSEGLLKLVPYGDTSAAGNGATWVAPSAFDAELDDTCFIVKKGKDPVKISSSPWTEGFNTVKIQWSNRANQYAPEVTPSADMAAINRYGSRIEDPQSWDFITTLDAAKFAGSIRLKRSVYTRNTYEFTLPFRFGHLEPMDIVSVTTNNAWSQDSNNTIQLRRCPARVTKIVDNPDGSYDVTCEDLISGAHTPDAFSKIVATPAPSPNQYADPGDTVPVILDAPLNLKIYDGNELWIGAAGDTEDWGGCTVYASTDGDTYKPIGTIKAPARVGTLNAALPAHADPDTADSLVVNLQPDSPALEAGTATDADNAVTLCYVDGELLAYSACAISGTDQYTMSTYLRRGLMGTIAGAHAQGSNFLRLDDTIFRYAYDSGWVGKTIYLKFQSFNSFGNSAQDLSRCAAYTFEPSGVSYPAPPVVTISQSATYSGASSSTSSNGLVNSANGLESVSTVYVTVAWTWPANYPAPSGFNVALLDGTDPTNPDEYIAPIAKVGASARSYTFAVTPSSSMTNVNAAVEAVYA